MKKRQIVPVLLSIIVSSAVFFVCGLLLIPAEISLGEQSAPAGEEPSQIPYYERENAALLFTLPDTSGALIYLDFENTRIDVTVYLDHATEQAEKSGHGVLYTLEGDVEMIVGLCDRLGGIELTEGGDRRRYFSAGLRQRLGDRLTREEKTEIAAAFFEKISKIGLSSGDFAFIIEMTDTNLSYPVCFGWIDWIKALAENTAFK